MTFCIGIKVNEGIVALADTRIVVVMNNLKNKNYSSLSMLGGHFLP